ncbi:MAG: hypothetical protein JWN38_1043 [Candidatus Saccharibacteria bacterium]|nr:hypothetical protein [Candidatus Saccharibacteria bacterium]
MEGSYNPFDADAALPIQASRGAILGRAGLDLDSPDDLQSPEISHGILAIAEQASDNLAAVLLGKETPQSVEFHTCSDLAVLQPTLEKLGDGPLAIGYGTLPPSVSQTWGKFFGGLLEAHRTEYNLGSNHLIPIQLRLPKWLACSSFELFKDISLVDITLIGDITGPFAAGLRYSKLTVEGSLSTGENEILLPNLTRCDITVLGDVAVTGAFKSGANCHVIINGSFKGLMGPFTSSSIEINGNMDEGRASGDNTSVFPPALRRANF